MEQALRHIAAGTLAHTLENRTLDFKRPMKSRDDTAKDMAEAAAGRSATVTKPGQVPW